MKLNDLPNPEVGKHRAGGGHHRSTLTSSFGRAPGTTKRAPDRSSFAARGAELTIIKS